LPGQPVSAGDPTLIGWVVFALHLTSASLCLIASKNERSGERRLWVALGCALLLLGLNKQLDLQSYVTHTMRELALAGGWYEQRRQAQALFLGALAVAGVLALIWILRQLRGASAGARLAAAGLTCLALFVFGRAASFHHLDEALGAGVGWLRLNAVAELTGSGMVAAGAVHAARSVRRAPRRAAGRNRR
jgi:hypothetical protein